MVEKAVSSHWVLPLPREKLAFACGGRASWVVTGQYVDKVTHLCECMHGSSAVSSVCNRGRRTGRERLSICLFLSRTVSSRAQRCSSGLNLFTVVTALKGTLRGLTQDMEGHGGL